jgi:hypothetical protein
VPPAVQQSASVTCRLLMLASKSDIALARRPVPPAGSSACHSDSRRQDTMRSLQQQRLCNVDHCHCVCDITHDGSDSTCAAAGATQADVNNLHTHEDNWIVL